MRRDKKILLLAEEQVVLRRYLSEVMTARDELRLTHPDSEFLLVVEAKIKRIQRAGGAR